MRNLNALLAIGIVLIIGMSGCTKRDNASVDGPPDAEDNDPVLVAKADSIVTHGGNERIAITWLLQSDSNVHSYRVSWYKNNHTDFVEDVIQKVNGRHVIHIIVDSIQEGSYYFDLRMYDEKGNSSARSTAMGTVYGPQYRSSLTKPILQSVSRSGNDVEVNFKRLGEGLVGQEIKYQHVNGDSVVQFVPEVDVSYTIKGVPADKPFKFRAAYLPEPSAIDTFYTDYLTAQVNSTYRSVEYYDSVSETSYFLTTIDHQDKSGNLIKLRLSLTDQAKLMGETASEFARRMSARLVFNASMSTVITNSSGEEVRVPSGVQIINGKIVQERSTNKRYILGIKEDNRLVVYPPNTPGQDILDDGTRTALSAFIPLILDHQAVSADILGLVGNSSQTHPRQVIAQLDNLDILFMTCGGRGYGGIGMTAEDLIRILVAREVKFAYNLDGGGSISTVIDGNFINWKIDSHGTAERLRANFLYVE